MRWVIHISILGGFMALLLMHGLDETISENLFDNYYSTLNPFQFLRNFFGFMIIAGLAMAAYKRRGSHNSLLFHSFKDQAALVILAVIMVSGFFLEAVKIVSVPAFNRMVDEFTMDLETEELTALQVYWYQEFDVGFSYLIEGSVLNNPELLEAGRETHIDNCADCHSKPSSAFLSYPLAKILKPMARIPDRLCAEEYLYFIHVIACLLALAYLPFSKFFHLITNPLTMLVNGMRDKNKPVPENAGPRRSMELDACTNCGACSQHCSVVPVFRILGNKNVLPAEKMACLKAMRKHEFSFKEWEDISEGALVCTECLQCTLVCPTAIDLQDQWITFKKGLPPIYTLIKKSNPLAWEQVSNNADAFSACIQCQTCNSVCPVVACHTGEDSVDITPQKIMNLLRMGLDNLAMSSRMVWNCTSCYQCQENCPQEIKIADIIYELKNQAYQKLKKLNQNV